MIVSVTAGASRDRHHGVPGEPSAGESQSDLDWSQTARYARYLDRDGTVFLRCFLGRF